MPMIMKQQSQKKIVDGFKKERFSFLILVEIKQEEGDC
jgi:ERCC4-related helicase